MPPPVRLVVRDYAFPPDTPMFHGNYDEYLSAHCARSTRNSMGLDENSYHSTCSYSAAPFSQTSATTAGSSSAVSCSAAQGRQNEQVPMQPLYPVDDRFVPFYSRALYNFRAEDSSEMDFCVDQVVSIVGQPFPGWLMGQLPGEREGLVPENYFCFACGWDATSPAYKFRYSCVHSTIEQQTQPRMVSTFSPDVSLPQTVNQLPVFSSELTQSLSDDSDDHAAGSREKTPTPTSPRPELA